MRYAAIAFSLLAVVGGVAFWPAGAAAATDYPLVCRGGPMQAHLKIGNPDEMVFSFTPGAQAAGTPAGQQALAGGQCSWLDRTLRQNEPHNVCLYPSHDQIFEVYWTYATPSLIKVAKIVNPSPFWFNDLGDPTKLLSFKVHNDGYACLVSDGSVQLLP
ncbi:MAG TPA: hypothetical protein VGZ06_05550 [Candidatus Cybelea sp.]|jgi:hypothetical protein|nr:hypothetical protein [Candidatus Cybelea sp.]